MKEALKEDLEEPVMNESVEDLDGEGLNRFYSNACYSCGEEGHFHSIAPRKEKSIWDTSRQKQWSLMHRE